MEQKTYFTVENIERLGKNISVHKRSLSHMCRGKSLALITEEQIRSAYGRALEKVSKQPAYELMSK